MYLSQGLSGKTYHVPDIVFSTETIVGIVLTLLVTTYNYRGIC